MRIRVLANRIIYISITSLTADKSDIISKNYIDITEVIDYFELSFYEKIPSVFTSYFLSL